MAMPVPIFDSMNLDLADLTGLADKGGFTFAADHYGLAGGSASLGGIEGDFFGLFEMEAEELTLTYDNTKDEFSIDGEIKIKSPILELIPGAKEPEFTFSDLKLKDGKFSFDGELAIEELKLPGGFGLSDLALALTLTDNVVTAFSGETHISLGEGKPEPVFGIGFKRPPLSFDKITLGVDSLGVPLGDGVFLEKIQGTLENLADVPPETAPGLPTQFTGTLGFGWGPEIEAFTLPELLGSIEIGGARVANLEVTGTMDFENTFNETITLNFLSDNLIKMTGVATLDLGRNAFSSLLTYDVLGGIATGQMETVANGHGITAHGNQALTIPALPAWGPISGIAGVSADAFLSISTDAPSQSFYAVWTTVQTPIANVQITAGFKLSADGFSLITGGNDLPKTHSFDVDGTEDWLLITASWENPVQGHVLTQVRMPGNVFIQEADYAEYGIALVPDLTNPNKTAIVIDHPHEGNWDLQVIADGVGAVTYHGISPNPAETFAFNDITSSPGDIDVSLGGLLVGAPAGSTVAFFYDTDDTGFDGHMIGSGTVNALGEVAVAWHLPGVEAGDYHVYAVAFDGMNAPTQVYADDIVHVALAPTDITVNGIAPTEGSPEISIREDTRPGTVVGRLGLVDPDFGSAATFTLLDDAGGRFALVGNQIVVTARAFLDADVGPIRQGEGGPIVPPPPVHTVTVQATDTEGFSITRDIQINVTDVLGDIDYIMGTVDGELLSGYDPHSPAVFLGRGGDDSLYGGTGEDIAVFTGFRRSYAFTAGSPANTIRDLRPDSPDGTDTVSNIETYRFADGDFTAAELGISSDVTLQITEFDPLAENATAGTLIAEASINNPLPGESYAFALADNFGGMFSLQGRQVLLNGTLDFETTSFYSLKVQATDTLGAIYEQSFTVDVSDVDENVPTTGPATGTPVIVGTIAQGQTLTVDAASVSDPDGIQFTAYQWQRSTDGGVTFTDVTAFSLDPTYVVVGADVGALLRVVVAVQDLLGNLSAVFSDPTTPVITTNHAPTGAPIISGISLVDETLTADASGIVDADGIPPFPTFTWLRVRAGTLEGAVGVGETYTPTAGDAGARLKVVVSYTDGGGIDETVESALSAPIASFPGETFPRLEFKAGGGTIEENLTAGNFVGTLLFDGADDPALIYTITSDPSGAFELSGNVLKLKNGVALDFEAAALRSLVISVGDGTAVLDTESIAVTVTNQPATIGSATHDAIPDATVFDDVLGLIGSAGDEGLHPRQWVNEVNANGPFWDVGPIEVEFALNRNSYRDFRGEFSQPFNNDQINAAFSIFALLSSFTDIDFVESSSGTQPHIKMAIGALPGGIGGKANGVGSDELLVAAALTSADPTLLGSSFHYVLMHELAHTLGLDHGSNFDFSDALPHLPLTHDRSAYSVMNQHNVDGTPQSYMLADIATLQYLYGADFTTNSGDTVYTWSETTGETFIDDVSMGATVSNYILMSLWDGGGNDTYDASNYGGGVRIDLRPGEFSTLSDDQLGRPGALGNVGNAYLYYGDLRSLIENAIGGASADTLMGNVGNNRLKGNGGADDLDGGDGTDTAVFTGNRADYAASRLGNGDVQITDLRSGTPDGIDVIRHVELFAFLDNVYSEATLFTGLPPVVTGPVTLGAILEDSPARLITQAELLAKASDLDSTTIAAANLAIATGLGTLTDNHNGTWSFKPATNDDTAVTFSFSVTDGVNVVAAIATLDITPVDDGPAAPPPPAGPTVTPGTPKDDSFEAPSGTSAFDGGLGSDTIKFDFRLVDATFIFSGGQVTVKTANSETVLTGFERFIFADGAVDNDDGNPLVDDLFYFARNHDVWKAGVDADKHFDDHGWKELRDPNAFFDTSLYLALDPGVKAAGINPLDHFHKSGWKEGRDPSFEFDVDKYLLANKDVVAAGVDPLEHFLRDGAQEHRVPIAVTEQVGATGFDFFFYLTKNPDVAAAGVDPFQHFQTLGWKEGRDPNALFDTKGYLAAYEDVAKAGINPLDHFHVYGWKESRDPSIAFDTGDYLKANPDVASAKIDPLEHYLKFGIHEGRLAFADGHFG